MRCSLTADPQSHIAYQPSPVPDGQIASGQLKRAVLGAAFAGCFEKILDSLLGGDLGMWFAKNQPGHDKAPETEVLPRLPRIFGSRLLLQVVLLKMSRPETARTEFCCFCARDC